MIRPVVLLTILGASIVSACGPVEPSAELIARAERGDIETQYRLGLRAAARKDAGEAIRWYEQAARQGHSGAQNNLGVLYAAGGGVPQDYSLAVMWYWLAAVQGNSVAQRNLGFMYEKGSGVQANWVLAHMWYNLAAASGDENAAQRRQELEERMRETSRETQISEAQSFARKWVNREFSEDMIVEAEEIAGLRKAPQGHAPPRGRTSEGAYFRIGSTKDEVLAIQGHPTSVDRLLNRETWWYGPATVTFQNGKVNEFNNLTGNLKARVK